MVKNEEEGLGPVNRQRVFQWFGNHQILQAQRASLPYTPRLFLGSVIQITETFYFNIQTSFYLNQPVPKLGASNIKDKLEAEDDTFNLVEIIVELNKEDSLTNL